MCRLFRIFTLHKTICSVLHFFTLLRIGEKGFSPVILAVCCNFINTHCSHHLQEDSLTHDIYSTLRKISELHNLYFLKRETEAHERDG
jgi:hypothetical protein